MLYCIQPGLQIVCQLFCKFQPGLKLIGDVVAVFQTVASISAFTWPASARLASN